jgi:hypothetical protein
MDGSKLKQTLNQFQTEETTYLHRSRLLFISNPFISSPSLPNPHLPPSLGIHRWAKGSIAATTTGLLVTLLPLHKVLLGELRVDGIHREQIQALGAHGHNAHFGLDVQHALLATGRPDCRPSFNLIVLEVVAFERAFEGGGENGLGKILVEIVLVGMGVESSASGFLM